jgi:O-antigen/teichoic acid export membrane protein
MLKSVLKDSFVQLFGRIAGVVLTITTLGIISRFYGPEGRGIYEAPTTYLLVFSSFLDLGIFLVALKKMSLSKTAEEKSGAMSEFLGYRILTGIIAYSAASIIAMFLGYSTTIQLGILMVGVSMFLVDLSQTLSAHFQSSRQMYKFVIGETLGRVLILSLTLTGAFLELDILFLISFILLGNTLHFAVCAYYASRDFKLRVDFSAVKRILIELLPIGSSAFLNALIQSLPALLVLNLHGESDFGIFRASDKIVLFLGIVPQIFMSAHFSNLTQMTKDKIVREGFKFSGAFGLLAFAGALVTPFLAEFAVMVLNFGNEEFLQKETFMIIGEQFTAEGSATVLSLSIVALIFIYAQTPLTYILFAIGMQKKLILPSLAGVLVCVSIGYLLALDYNYIGAGITSILAHLLVLVFLAFNFYKIKKNPQKYNLESAVT